MTRTRTTIRLLVFALAAAMCAPALVAQHKGEEQTYVITLKSEVGRAGDVASDLARLYGGTAEQKPEETEGAVRMRLTRARARVLAADPRVASVTATAAMQPNAVTEAVGWSAGVSYTYDGSGNVHKIGNDTFNYDHANRLITANVNGTPRDYSYDGFGNRTGCVQWANTSSQAECQKGKTIDAVENRNRLKGVPYDDAGNVTALDGHQYVYDVLNMMKRDIAGTQAREFIYTADDERIAVYNVGSSWRWTVRDEDGKILREFTSSNGPNGAGTASWQWTRDNVWRENVLLATRQPENQTTSTYFYHLDHLGSPRRITDTNDRIVGSHDYFAYGPEISGGTTESNPGALKYTGHERDSWGGLFGTLDYMHARFYDPDLGRFLSVDPAMSPANPRWWNRYAYGLNNPLAFTDPDGLAPAFFVTTTFRKNEFYDKRVSDYIRFNATGNYNIAERTATQKNFEKGLSQRDAVSIYFGHSNAVDSLKFNGGYGKVADFQVKNRVACFAACNTASMLGDVKIGKGQALIGVTSNLTMYGLPGFVKAGDLSYISTQIMEGLKAGRTIGQIVDKLNEYYTKRAKKDPNYKVEVKLVGDRDVKYEPDPEP